MVWWIDDLDQYQLRISNWFATYYVPKFRIQLVIEEPYLYIYYNDEERGDGGKRRVLKINYLDVADGYGGYLSNPSSAAQLAETIEAYIISGWTDIVPGLTFVSVDGVTITGDGTPGDPLVAVSTSSTPTELTPELFADGNITGTGANQFLNVLGYSDGQAALAWPLTAANYPGGLTAAGFTLDTVAWQEMFYYAEANGASYMTTQINFATDDVNKTYYVNKTLYLPRTQSVASNRQSLTFQIDFKGARVRNSSGGDMVLFDRYPTDQTDADSLVSYQYCFWNGVLRGNGGTTDADTIIRLGATSRCEFKNINFEHAGVMVDLQFCLEPLFKNINVSDYGYWGLAVRNGQWSGAGFFNAQSNILSVENFRSYNSPGGTPNAAIYCDGNHTIECNHLTFEGDVGSEHHFFYNNDGSAGTNICNLRNIYIEYAGCTRAAIRFRAGKGQFVVSEFRSSVVLSDMPCLIEGDNDRSPTSSLYIILKNCASGALISKLRAVGDPNYPVEWYAEHVRMIDNTQFNVAANFDTGTIANSYVPDDDHVQFMSTDGIGSGVWVDGVTITGQGTEASPFIGHQVGGANLWAYKAKTTATSGDPASSHLIWNNATQISATQLNLSHITDDGFDIDLYFPYIVTGDQLVVQDRDDSTNYQIWTVSGATTIHPNSYIEIPVTLDSSGGTGTTNFANNHQLLVAKFGATSSLLPDGDYGDISVSSSGSVMTIDNDVVTFAKMQNIATDRLLGRDTAASGDVEELTVSGGLEFSGAGGIQRSALTGDVTASAGSGATTIANDAVTFAKMQNIATDRVLGRDTVGSGDIEELTLGANMIITGGALDAPVKEYHICAIATWNPVDGSTVHFNGTGNVVNTGAANLKNIILPACTITEVDIIWTATSAAGSNESIPLSMRLNDTTDIAIATISDTAAIKRFRNTGLSQAMNGTTDYVCFKIVCPTWGTNPTSVGFQGFIKYRLS